METALHLKHLRCECLVLAEAAAGHLEAPVAACPGWDVIDVVRHVGELHRWVADMTSRRSLERLPRPRAGELAGDDLLAWFEAGARDLLEVLSSTPPDTPVWTFGPPPAVSFWCRRMAHETAMHRVDVQDARDCRSTLAPDIATDGVTEFLELRLIGADLQGLPADSLLVNATDTGDTWTVRPTDGRLALEAGTDPAGAYLTGRAVDLLLFLWRRTSATHPSLEGPPESVTSWRTVLASLAL